MVYKARDAFCKVDGRYYMSDILKELEKLKEELESAKRRESKAEGKISAILERLKRDYKIKSEEVLNEEIEKIMDEMESCKNKISKKHKALKEKYKL